MRTSAEHPRAADVPPWANLTRTQELASAVVFAVAYVGHPAQATYFDLPNGVAAWYPPAAVMFAYLLIAGPRYVPFAIVVGIVSDLVNYPEAVAQDGVAPVLVGACIGATVYGWGAWVLRQSRLDHARVRQFGWFAVIGVAACPLLAASGFALVQVVLNDVSAEVARDQAGTFWVGDAVAIASIVPFLLLAAYAKRHGSRPVRLPEAMSERVEIFAQAVAVVVVPVGIFALRQSGEIVPFLFLAMIPVIWVALRQDLLVASFGVLVTNSLVAVGARIRLGATEDFVAVQTLMLAAALAALYAGAVRRTENERLADTLESETRYRTLIENSPALVARFDRDGDLLLHAGRLDPDVEAGAITAGLATRWADLAPVLASDRVADLEWSLDGSTETRWLETRAVVEPAADGSIASLLTVTSDRTAARRAADELATAARRDVVTGLPNRIAVDELVEQGSHPSTAPPREPRAVVAVVLDDADAMIAGLGRLAADQIAVAMADRLRQVVDGDDVLARVDRTGYAVVTRRLDELGRLAAAAVDAFADPIELDGEAVHLRASAGVSAPDEDRAVPALEHAELAARFAQDAGAGRVATFTPSMVTEVADIRAVIQGLRRGIDRDELVVHYQPIVALDDGRVLGAEALVRWQRPDHGLVGPVEFIEIAEQSGLIDDIGAAVERITRDELLGSRPSPAPSFALNLNVAAPQLAASAFPARIGETIAAFAAAGIDLHLELTETAIMADPAEACAVLAGLRDAGARIVLDDFGTGFSAISWLHQLPVDAIKLDRSFVSGLPDDDASLRIARLVTTLANELDLALTAEGVETDEQRRALVALGCTQAQGYLFARPAPLADLLLALDGTLPTAPR
jgi:predicted signal transduction protein with EAL and GGDEF domain